MRVTINVDLNMCSCSFFISNTDIFELVIWSWHVFYHDGVKRIRYINGSSFWDINATVTKNFMQLVAVVEIDCIKFSAVKCRESSVKFFKSALLAHCSSRKYTARQNVTRSRFFSLVAVLRISRRNCIAKFVSLLADIASFSC